MNISRDIKICSIRNITWSVLLILYFLNFTTDVLAKITNESSFFEWHTPSCYSLFSEKIEVYFPYYEKEMIGNYNAYRMDFPASEEDYPIHSNTYYIKEDVSKVFWKETLLFASHVMSIYNKRKIHLGKKFLRKWSSDIKRNKYNSFLVRVFSDQSNKVLGTVRFVASDVLHALPLEKFLKIRIDDINFDRYEIGLLTVNRDLPAEERYRVHLELWINLVSFFKERRQDEVKVYAFSDSFGTRMYTSWGFSPVQSYYKKGKRVLLSSETEYKKGLQLDNKVQMGVLEYVLSKKNLEKLLYHISGGRYTIESEEVINRLKSLDLYDVFEEDENTQIITNISEFMNLMFSSELYNHF